LDIYSQQRFLIHLRDRFGIAPDYEKILQEHYLRFLKAGDVVFDIGGNEGVHATKLAEIVGAQGVLHVFEPIPDLAAALQERFARQSHVTVHNVALSNFHGQSEFVLAKGVLSESGLKERKFSNPAMVEPTRIQVQVERLDDFTRDTDRLDYIKMDIEGGELDCLSAAVDTLGRLRPVMSVEYGAEAYAAYGHRRGDLWDLCQRNRYALFDIIGNRIPDAEVWDRVCDRVYWDYLCVPSEKLEWFVSRIGPGP